MIKRFIFFFCFSLLINKSILAGESNVQMLGVALPSHITLEKTAEQLTLNGYAARTLWGEKIYVAALYTVKVEKKPEMMLMNDEPMAMIYYIVQDDIAGSIFFEALLESILINNQAWDNKQLDRQRLTELQSAMNIPFNAGDMMAFHYSPKNGIIFIINGKVQYHWPLAKSFFNMLLRTWVGPFPPDRMFKRAILNFPV